MENKSQADEFTRKHNQHTYQYRKRSKMDTTKLLFFSIFIMAVSIYIVNVIFN